ncbi:uncharacterized protein LOC132739193 [Ruditapes philippinarum]|uniref:uncharacterized protein LOC132739193 n=1 Tax=Ruditapes philippinarum TaxID=129788 RepID=UPI00295AAF89|nr:uncharacterized protein LOC132739193 [Ruditapes philippinarum]
MGLKLTDSNPNVTDLSDRHRPTKLAEKYAELYDNQWTDAFDVLDKIFPSEEKIINILLNILLDVMRFCKEKATEQMKLLTQHLQFTDTNIKGDNSTDFMKLVKDCRKAAATTAMVNLKKIHQLYLTQSANETLKTALDVEAITSECLEVCWFMAVQDPPVAFAALLTNGSSFETELYKPYTISGTHVEYVVWPPLVLHENGPILAKGIAQGCGKKL